MQRLRNVVGLFPELPMIADLVGTVCIALFLAWSRFALLASGPWEWDEVIFARGLMEFELAAHFPHPPGFPGWMGIGHLLLVFVDEPLRALQVGSAALSVAMLWPLVVLGRRLAHSGVATAAAMLVLVAPGPWLHAVRGFSSTPAVFFLLSALALLTVDPGRLRPTVVTVLLASAVAVRPQVLPLAAIAWLSLAVRVRAWRRLIPGIVISLVGALVSLVLMAVAEGGFAAFFRACSVHATRHFSRLADNPARFEELGLVKAFGGAVPWAAVLVLTVVGLIAWSRGRSRREAAVAAALVVVMGAELLYLHNRTYTRYTVPLAVGVAPLVAAGSAAAAPPVLATAGLLGLAAVVGARSWPLVVEQHAARLPGWEVVDRAARRADRMDLTTVVEPGLYPYASYRWYRLGGGEMPNDTPLVLSPWAPHPWEGVDRPYVVATDMPTRYLAPLARGSIDVGGVSPQLEPLTQQRFLDAALVINPPLPVGEWWPVEITTEGERFMWGGRSAKLALPPLPAGTWLSLDLAPARGPAPLPIVVDGHVFEELPGTTRRSRRWIPPDLLTGSGGHSVEFCRSEAYRPGGSDARPLSVKLFSVRAVGPGVPWGGSLATVAGRERIRARVEGAYRPERFGVGGTYGMGAWSAPEAAVVVPAGEGTLKFRLAAPRKTPPCTVIRSEGRVLAGPLEVGPRPGWYPLRIPTGLAHGEGRIRVEITSRPFVPAEVGNSSDRRRLGVVLSRVEFSPPREMRRDWGW